MWQHAGNLEILSFNHLKMESSICKVVLNEDLCRTRSNSRSRSSSTSFSNLSIFRCLVVMKQSDLMNKSFSRPLSEDQPPYLVLERGCTMSYLRFQAIIQDFSIESSWLAKLFVITHEKIRRLYKSFEIFHWCLLRHFSHFPSKKHPEKLFFFDVELSGCF